MEETDDATSLDALDFGPAPSPSAPTMSALPLPRPSAPAMFAATRPPAPSGPGLPAPAFGRPPDIAPAPPRDREILDLIWSDPTPAAPPETRDRRAMVSVLTRATPIDLEGLGAALAGAARDD
ncbi:MAG TPA: hypothetical protein VLS89_08325, partial [Candidatus Nanopelagicales bacterium]|nr:hypothetical protein [Candidatus Nanopelagicales bacterium]